MSEQNTNGLGFEEQGQPSTSQGIQSEWSDDQVDIALDVLGDVAVYAEENLAAFTIKEGDQPITKPVFVSMIKDAMILDRLDPDLDPEDAKFAGRDYVSSTGAQLVSVIGDLTLASVLMHEAVSEELNRRYGKVASQEEIIEHVSKVRDLMDVAYERVFAIEQENRAAQGLPTLVQ